MICGMSWMDVRDWIWVWGIEKRGEGEGGERERELTWIDQQTAPMVPRTLAAMGTSIVGIVGGWRVLW